MTNAHSPKYIVFLVSPSLGVVDNVAPVLIQLREKYPQAKAIGFFPRPSVLRQVQTNPSLLRKLELCTDYIGFNAFGISETRLFPTADFFIETRLASHLDNVPGWMGRIPIIYRIFVAFLNLFYCHNLKTKKIKSSVMFAPRTSMLIGDFGEVEKPYMSCIRQVATRTPFFGINHGVDVDLRTEFSPGKYYNLFLNRHCFLFSQRETEYYLNRFGLSLSELSVVGVQKHDEQWLSWMGTPCMSVGSDSSQLTDEVLLISRPSGSEYLPSRRKEKALQVIRDKVIKKFRYKLLVKLHPKETDKKIFESIFGRDTQGKAWDFTNQSVDCISLRPVFAISFYSGLSTDLIRFGVPVIEYLDLEGLPGIEALGAKRMDDGSLALSYKANGLVLPAATSEELQFAIDRIRDERHLVLAHLESSYNNLFDSPNGSVTRTVETIERIYKNLRENNRGIYNV